MSLRDIFKRATPEEKAAKRADAINKAGLRGINKLFRAVEKNDLRLVKRLLAEGADVNARTQTPSTVSIMMYSVPYAKGSTPLHAAALLGHDDIARLLLEKGADINARNNEGHTPLDYALISQNWYENDYGRKKESSLSLPHYVRKTGEKVKAYNDIIRTFLGQDGKTGLFKLPEKFEDLLPKKKQLPRADINAAQKNPKPNIGF
ncbi:MAG TPA: ankyrin repeat domain-containing protein [Alphaproteobacteria bacterium]|jgi:hypothetical protein|nr:ankyrin repeat domain-containing protein [Alphaproteobacteria bacterium]